MYHALFSSIHLNVFFSFVAASFDLGILELGIFICSRLVSCMVFSCVARLFRLMDFRTEYFSLLWLPVST